MIVASVGPGRKPPGQFGPGPRDCTDTTDRRNTKVSNSLGEALPGELNRSSWAQKTRFGTMLDQEGVQFALCLFAILLDLAVNNGFPFVYSRLCSCDFLGDFV